MDGLLTAIAPRVAQRTDAELLEEYAFRYGRSYDSYLVTEPGRECFWSSGRRGVIAFVRVGRYLMITGGLLAPEDHKADLLAELAAYARERRLVLSFCNIAEDERRLFTTFGFQVTKWGEEAIVELSTGWEGSQFQWVRRQSSFCIRQGLVFYECDPELLLLPEWGPMSDELRQVATETLAAQPQACEMKLLEGSFDPLRLGRKRLFIARSGNGDGRIEGFLVANPCADGRMWAFELYRHRADAVRGTVAFLMHQAMQQLAAEGVERVSLCLVPGQGCGEPLTGDSRLVRWALVCGSRYFNFIFDSAGPAYFKSRFRPRYESRYLCVWPRVTLGSAWAFVRALGVLKLDWPKTARLCCGRMRKRFGRGRD